MRRGWWMVGVALGAVLFACDRSPSGSGGPGASASAEPVAPTGASAAVAAPPPSASVAAPEARASQAPSAEVAPPETSAAPVASAAPRPRKGKVGPSTSIQLLSAGKAPLTKLRYKFVADRTERVAMTTETAMNMSVGGKEASLPMAPGVEVTAALTVLSVDADGSARRKLVLEAVKLVGGGDIDGAARKQAEENLGLLAKLTGKDRVDARGFVRQVEFDTSKVESAEMRQSLATMQQTFDQMGAPFPEEEIGPGAKWQVRTKLEQMGIKLEQTASYELVEVNGDQGRIKVVLTQKAPGGELALPGLPQGGKADLLGMKGAGAGELDFDLNRSVPKGHIDTQAEIKVKVVLGNGLAQHMIHRMKAKVVFAPL